jgi:starch synthase
VLVTYNAPNRAHHYAYAKILADAGALHKFVRGFSRFSPRAAIPEVGDRLVCADHVQNFHLLAQKFHMTWLAEELAWLSKLWLDRSSEKWARESDLFLFYNGAGLNTLRKLKSAGVASVTEVVNSHVLIQQKIIREEHERLGLPFRPFHSRDVRRRVAEYEEADAVLAPSEFVKGSFTAMGFAAGKILKVPYGFTPPHKMEHQVGDTKGFRVLNVGQVHIRKGLRYLFEAFRSLRHPDKELWIVGPKADVTGIEDIQPPPETKFLGVLKGEELAHAYQSASVFVFPSLEDGFGLVLGEALSYGVPVIATVNTGAADIFEDGFEGWQVPIRDPQAIAQKLQQLADDPALMNEMSQRAIERAKQLGGWETTGKLLLEALRSVVVKKKLKAEI